ncbi:hypothetical protein ACI6Q2_02870 [Chitinophagaceae bacterium LWZ2-11]
MIKKKKAKNPHVGEVYAIRLENESWAVGQICHMQENEDESGVYYSLTVAFWGVNFNNIEELRTKISVTDLDYPAFVFSVAGNPFRVKKWVLIDDRVISYKNINIESQITGSWGWFDKTERDINWILEMYFGVYPWDSFADPLYMDKLLIPGQKKPRFARPKSMFTKEELMKLGLA